MASGEALTIRRLRNAGLAATLAVCIVSAMVPSDSIMPTDSYTIAGGCKIYIPRGVGRVRGIMLNDNMELGLSGMSHNTSVMCHLWDFAWITMDRSMVTAAQKAVFQTFFVDAAKASGHPEVANVPIIYDCGRWLETTFVPQVKDKIISATLFDGVGDATKLGKNTLSFYYVYDCRHDDMIPNMPTAASSARSQGLPLGYYPVWGWTRGHFNGKSYAWAARDWAVWNMIPSGTVPADGKMTLKTISLQDGWLGDPSTWTGDYPKAYRYSEFGGDKNKAPWIPDEYTARVWRATVARHPTLTNRQNPSWGIMRSGTHGDDTYDCSSPPQVGVIQPISIYNKDPYEPIMVPRDTILRVRIGCDYTTMKELRVYEGHRHFTTLKPSPYNVYFANCTLSTPGIRAIIVEAVLNDGKVITSWPATVFVNTERSAAATVVGEMGRLSPVTPERIAVGPDGNLRVMFAGALRQDVTVEIHDPLGRMAVARTCGSANGRELTVRLDGLAPGTYVAVIGNGPKRYTTSIAVPVSLLGRKRPL